MSIGRQGFVSNQRGVTYLPTPWIGRWVEAYFADNSSQFQQAVAEPRPYASNTPTINGRIRGRATPLGAVTTEYLDTPVHDIKNKAALFSSVPGSLFALQGRNVSYKPLGGELFPYSENVWRFYGGSTFPTVTRFTISAADVALVNPSNNTALLHFVIFRGKVTNITTGVIREALTPTISPTATNMLHETLPAEYATLVVSSGDVIELDLDVVIGTYLLLKTDTTSLRVVPVANNGFDQPRYDYSYANINNGSTAAAYVSISDRGSPTSLQGPAWVDAIYPDVPAYKIELEIFVENPEFYLQYTYQGGAGITSYGTLSNIGATSNMLSHYNTPLPNSIQPKLAANTWHKLSFEIRPADPSSNINGFNWVTTASLNGVNLGDVLSNHPDLILATTPNLSLGAIYLTPSVPMLIRNFRLSYWERL